MNHFKRYLPSFFPLLISVTLLALMTLPYSQYSLLSHMAELSQISATGEVNLCVLIPGFMVLLNILCLVAVFLLSFICCFFFNIYLLKFIHNFILFLMILIPLNLLIYFSVGYQTVINEIDIVTSLQWIPLFFSFISTFFYLYFWKQFIIKPYREEIIKREEEQNMEFIIEEDRKEG